WKPRSTTPTPHWSWNACNCFTMVSGPPTRVSSSRLAWTACRAPWAPPAATLRWRGSNALPSRAANTARVTEERRSMPRSPRPRADRHGAELVVAPLPGKGLGLGQCLQQQVHPLEEPGSAFGRVHSVGQVLAGDAPQERHDYPSTGQVVQHANLLGSPDGIVML